MDVTPEFAAAISDPLVRKDAQASCDRSFACRYMHGYVHWNPTFGIHPELRDVASELLAFDVFIHNFDRTAENSNLLTRRDELLAIDHDLACEFVYPPGRSNPGVDPRLDLVQKHAFGRVLKGRFASAGDFRASVMALDDAWFDALRRATPPEWCVGQAVGVLDRILEVLRERRDHAAEWLTQVEAWME